MGPYERVPLNQYDPSVVRKEDWQVNNIEWIVDGTMKFKDGTAKHVIDMTTGKKYLNEPKELVRVKCIYPGLLPFIPIMSVVAGVFNIIYRSAKVLSGYHFWSDKTSEKIYQFKAEIGGKDCHFQTRFDDLHFIHKFFNPNEITAANISSETMNGIHRFTIIYFNENNIQETIILDAKKIEINDSDQNDKTDETASLINPSQDAIKQDHPSNEIRISELKEIEKTYDVKARFTELAKDIVRIVASFFILIGLVSAALYGLWEPYEGRKLISTIALAVCGTSQVAACFSPNPSFHALGGDINTQNAF